MNISDFAAYAVAMDRQDELAHFRTRFVIDDPDLIYLDGNSLGRLPLASADRLTQMVQNEWGNRLIRSWNEGWIELPQRLGAKIGRIIGAQPQEIVIADSTSVNLFKLVTAALRLQQANWPDKTVIITDNGNFPSDIYILQGALDLLGGFTLKIVPVDLLVGATEAIVAAIDERTALVALSHTAFKSGYVYDMAQVTAAAHAAGALALWDLSHSVGAIPVDLNGASADFAVGCTYKYVNGGPGAPAFLFVREALHERVRNPVSGWFGQQEMFAFDLDYAPAAGIGRFLTGTPPLLSLAAIEPGIDLLLEAGMSRLRAKSVQQTEFLIALWRDLLAPLGFTLNSPVDATRRGSHVSLGHAEALRIDLALIEAMNVLPDFRAPDNLRLGIAPLYTSFGDVYQAVLRMKRVVDERLYESFSAEGIAVT